MDLPGFSYDEGRIMLQDSRSTTKTTRSMLPAQGQGAKDLDLAADTADTRNL